MGNQTQTHNAGLRAEMAQQFHVSPRMVQQKVFPQLINL